MMSRHVTANVTPKPAETPVFTNVTDDTPVLLVRARTRARKKIQLAQVVYIRDPRIRSDI